MLYHRQKHAVRVTNFKDNFFHAEPLLREMNVLSIYKSHTVQTPSSMFNCKIGRAPSVFSDTYRRKPNNKYPLRSIRTLCKPYYGRIYFEFIISFRGPHIWNKILLKNLPNADIQSSSLFKTINKSTISTIVNLITKFY